MRKFLNALIVSLIILTFFNISLVSPSIEKAKAEEQVWVEVNNGLYGGTIRSLVIDPTDTQTIYAGTYGGIFKSTNGGLSWTAVNTGLTNFDVHYLAIDPQNPTIIYAGTRSKGVFKTTTVYTITSSVEPGGTISPSGSVSVSPGETQKFTITANTGYRIKQILVDGNPITITNALSMEYTFTNVTSDHTIQASFEQLSFKITSSAGTGGTISPSGTASVNYGDSKTFTITPSYGYKVSDVKIDGKSIGPVSSYTFTNIIQDHTIEAIFEKSEIVIILQIGNKYFTVNGETRTLDSPPIIKNGRTLLPIRAVVEALGGQVEWNDNTKAVTIRLGSNTIILQIGNANASVNGKDTPIDPQNLKVVPEIINSRTMLPLRFVAENLGATVDWDGTTKKITITYTK